MTASPFWDFLSRRAPARTVWGSGPSRQRWRKSVVQQRFRHRLVPKSAAPTVRGCPLPRTLLLRKSRPFLLSPGIWGQIGDRVAVALHLRR